LQAADETFRDEEQFVANYLSLRQNPRRFPAATFAVIDEFRGTAALKRFDLFAKAYQLRSEWKLEPALMHEINQTHGPIDLSDPNVHYPMDWRHPDCHAIYWAVKALKLAAEQEDREITTYETNTDRIVAHSHQNLFRYGKMMILEGPAEPSIQDDPNATTQSRLVRKDIFLGPDYRMFDSYNKATLAILEKHKDDKGRYVSLRNGYRNMLKNAVLTFYQSGIRGYALRIYNQLRQSFPEIDDFKVSLDQYAKNRLAEELESIDILNARELIVATLAEAYYHYALRSDDLAAAREQIAQKIYDYYMAKFRPENRIDLPDMRELRYFALGSFLNNEAYPPYVRQGLLARIRASGMHQELLGQLTPSQRQAVLHREGPLLVLAGPGSGKTRVITYRIAALVSSGINAYNICAITFTNKAAEEMRQRAAALGASAGARISTFHSLCVRILRRYAGYAGIDPHYSIYDEADQTRCIKQAIKECNLDATNFPPRRMLEAISTLKNKLIDATAFAADRDDFFSRTLAQVYARYQELLAARNALDFDDLLMKATLLLENNATVRQELSDRFQYLLIDEYQDTNHAQYRLANTLAARHGNICATGDPDQSIYRWRGADIRNILAFERDWPQATVVKLQENFRSTPAVLEVADRLIACNRNRKEKAKKSATFWPICGCWPILRMKSHCCASSTRRPAALERLRWTGSATTPFARG